MEYRELGKSGLKVSRIAFGTLSFKLRDMSVEDGAEVLVGAAEQGINLIDTAEFYDTYRHVHEALKRIPQDVIISTKCYAKDAESMRKSLDNVNEEIGVDPIGLFKMHGVDTLEDLEARRPAWDVLVKAREEGRVRAIGVSTHSSKVVDELAKWSDVEVILTVLNNGRRGIIDCTMEEMLASVDTASAAGKFIYLMKIFAGGVLYNNAREALEYGLRLDSVDCIAVGMQNMAEVGFNVAVASSREIPEEVQKALDAHLRELSVRPFCNKCGVCLDACRYGALTMGEKWPEVDREKCIVCGYCGVACPQMNIKVI